MMWKKALAWIMNIAFVLVLVLFVEGQLLWLGISAVLLIVCWKIYRKRNAIKVAWFWAGMIGKEHRKRNEKKAFK
ncbi:hypothetical protein ES702_04922 [subsurface metagenome]